MNNNMNNNRRANLNSDNNRIAVVNAYIENTNNNRSIMQQMMDLMTNQESTMRDLVQDGIMLNDNTETSNRHTRANATANPRTYTHPNLSRRRSNSETNNIFTSINGVSERQRQNSQRPSRSFRTPPTASEERLTNMLVSMILPTFTGQPNEANDDFLTPVIVRPTLQQITRATEVIRYGDIINPPNSTCPIHLHHFDENDNVTRIMYCGHIFTENSLNTWFNENVRCPMCRYDIRTYTGNNIGGYGRRDINASNINTEPLNEQAENNMTNALGQWEQSETMTNLPETIAENIENASEEEAIENNSDNRNNVSRQSPLTTSFPANAFAGLFTSSLDNGNDVSNILNTFMTDLQNDPFFSNFTEQSRNGRFDVSGNYIFETYIPIPFNRPNSNNNN